MVDRDIFIRAQSSIFNKSIEVSIEDVIHIDGPDKYYTCFFLFLNVCS